VPFESRETAAMIGEKVREIIDGLIETPHNFSTTRP
jgi:hypothetical protein